MQATTEHTSHTANIASPQEGDIVFCRFSLAMGDKIDGDHPTIAMAAFGDSGLFGVPLTSVKPGRSNVRQFCMGLNPEDGVERPSIALTDCCQFVEPDQIVRTVGRLNSDSFVRLLGLLSQHQASCA